MRGQLCCHHFVFLASCSKHYDPPGLIAKFKVCGKSPDNEIPFKLWKHWRNSLDIWPKNYALAR